MDDCNIIKSIFILLYHVYLAGNTPESERALFKEEFDTMTRIGNHPNVVNILGSCEHEGKNIVFYFN